MWSVLQTFLAASVDSGSQENWTGQKRRGRQKGSTSQQQVSSSLSQPRARVLRGHRLEAMEEGESTPAESDSSDQGEATAPFTHIAPNSTSLFYIKCTKTEWGSLRLWVNSRRSKSEELQPNICINPWRPWKLCEVQISNLRGIASPGDEWGWKSYMQKCSLAL